MSIRSSLARISHRLTQRACMAARALALLAVFAVLLQPAVALTQSALAAQTSPATQSGHHMTPAAADHDHDGSSVAKPMGPAGHSLIHLGSCLSICCLAMLPVIAPLAPDHCPASIRRKPPIADRLVGEAPALDPPPPRSA